VQGFVGNLVTKNLPHDEDKASRIEILDIFPKVSIYQETKKFKKLSLIINQDSPAPAMSICSFASSIGV